MLPWLDHGRGPVTSSLRWFQQGRSGVDLQPAPQAYPCQRQHSPFMETHQSYSASGQRHTTASRFHQIQKRAPIVQTTAGRPFDQVSWECTWRAQTLPQLDRRCKRLCAMAHMRSCPSRPKRPYNMEQSHRDMIRACVRVQPPPCEFCPASAEPAWAGITLLSSLPRTNFVNFGASARARTTSYAEWCETLTPTAPPPTHVLLAAAFGSAEATSQPTLKVLELNVRDAVPALKISETEAFAPSGGSHEPSRGRP